jgi:hypothetical protein
MRRVTTMLSVTAVVLMAASMVAQTKPTFAGQWFVPDESARGQGALPKVELTITQNATAMTLEYGDGQAPAPVKLTYKLDGSVNKNMVTARGAAPTEQLSKAVWAGNTIVVTTTTAVGEEKRTFSMNAGDLVIETSAPARKGAAPTITKVTYKKYERGFGG